MMSTSSLHKTAKQKSATKQQPTVASSLRGAWANRKSDKFPKSKTQSGMASPVVNIKEVDRPKRTIEQTRLFEKIAGIKTPSFF